MTEKGARFQSSSTALIVVGMHRSGTSATAGALQCLGIRLGEHLYAGHAHVNAKGYFEHSDIADTNDRALMALGSSWDDILPRENGWWQRDELEPFARRILRYIRRDFSGTPLWAVKDPRVARLIPWWLEILAAANAAPRFLFVVRSADAVFRSLRRRDGFSRDKAHLLWLLHYLEAERWSRGFPRAFLGYDRFMENPIEELRRVAQALDLALPVPVEQAGDCLAAHLSADLRHHGREPAQDEDLSPISALARDLEITLRAAETGVEPDLDPTVLDGLSARLNQLPPEALVPTLREHLRSIARERGQLALTLGRVMRSWSWYLGKPVRFAERLAGREV